MTNDERSTNSRNRNYSPDRGIEYSLQRAVLPWGEARGRECIQGDTRPTEQRSPRAKRPLPEGLRRFWLVASLLVGSQSAAAMLPLLAPRHKPKSPATNCILSRVLVSKRQWLNSTCNAIT